MLLMWNLELIFFKRECSLNDLLCGLISADLTGQRKNLFLLQLLERDDESLHLSFLTQFEDFENIFAKEKHPNKVSRAPNLQIRENRKFRKKIGFNSSKPE